MIYFDYNATTPLCGEALRAMDAFVSIPGNPSSPHKWGRKARVALDAVREDIRNLAGAIKADVIFTSGGTEGDHLALHAWASLGKSTQRNRIVFAQMEHPAIHGAATQLKAEGFDVCFAEVKPNGEVDIESIKPYCDEKLAVVAVMLANNETGVIQPVGKIAQLAKACGAMVHCDAVQGTGKIPLNFAELFVDSLAISAHKFGGPKGVGALVLPKGNSPEPLWAGGGQEDGFRSGTEAAALIIGMGAAAKAALDRFASDETKTSVRDHFEAQVLQFGNTSIVGVDATRLPTTSTVCFHGRLSHQIVEALNELGVCVSGGAACHSGGAVPSQTMLSLGMSEQDATATVRFSFGPGNTIEEVDAVIERLENILFTKGREQ